jgi:hypothetical protein
MLYKHTQIGYLMIFVLFLLVLYFGFIFTRTRLNPVFIAVMLFIIFLVASFATLDVMIDEKYLRIKFGYGIFRKKFTLQKIISAKSVKNHWYYGWGIRYWIPSRIWIFNIFGFGAVEIKMKNGKTYRIGTDEPKNLERAIMRVIK